MLLPILAGLAFLASTAGGDGPPQGASVTLQLARNVRRGGGQPFAWRCQRALDGTCRRTTSFSTAN